MAEPQRSGRPHVVVALPQCRGRTIADNALHRARALSRSLRVTMISDAFPDAPPAELRCLSVAPARFDFLRRLAHVPNEIALARAVLARLRTLEREDPFRFVLCHGYTLTRLAGLPLRRSRGVACGMFMHGHIFSRPHGTYDPRLTAWYRRIAPRCYARSDLIVALSPAQKALAQVAGADPGRVVVAPNGLDARDLGLTYQGIERTRANAPEPGAALRILYVGRLSVEKGVDVLLDACARLADADTAFELTVIGDGPERERVGRTIERPPLAGRVRLLGALARRDLGTHYLDADVLCVPSRDEPLGTVVLEGMVTGCLVVASRTGGIPSMIRDGVDGVLVPAQDPAALAAALGAAAASPARTREAAVAARASVRERFDWDAAAAAIRAALAERLGI